MIGNGDDMEVLLDGLTFPEAPRWRQGRLWFSDFYSGRVIALDLRGEAITMANVPQRPSGLGWLPDGTLLIVSMLDRRVFRSVGGGLVLHADLSGLAGGPCNDMVVDRQGRAYVGNFGFDRYAREPPRVACLARVDLDGSIVRAAEGLEFPNGAVITPDGKRLIVAETLASRLTVFDIGLDGGLSNRRIFAAIDSLYPDGICLDAEGAVWVADPKNRCVLRIFEGGEVAGRIELKGRGAYACALGGKDRMILFLCTNTTSGPAAAEAQAGRIEAMQVAVPGV